MSEVIEKPKVLDTTVYVEGKYVAAACVVSAVLGGLFVHQIDKENLAMFVDRAEERSVVFDRTIDSVIEFLKKENLLEKYNAFSGRSFR